MRFGGQGSLRGHAVGNLLIAALWQRDADPVVGLDRVGRLLNAQGRVLPMASIPLDVAAEVRGVDPSRPDQLTLVRGQHKIAVTEGCVEKIWLEPNDPPASGEALRSIAEADYLVFGPGSWFTSVVPHLLVPQLREAVVASRAKKICVMNLLSVLETAGFTASRHLDVLHDHCPGLRLDIVLVDPRFANGDSDLVATAEKLGGKLVVSDVGMRDGSPRHDPFLLAASLANVMEL